MRTTAWITGILAITISLMAGSRPCFALNTQDTGYQITSADQTIDVFGACKQVRASRSLFAPTKSSNEWNGFLNWATSNTNTLTLTACATCSDGIKNQGETGIDCGGPCPACTSCSDGIKNQGETGIDCGGPCPACSSCGGYAASCTNGCCPGLSCQVVVGTGNSGCYPSPSCTPIGSPCTSDAECCPNSGGVKFCNTGIIGGAPQNVCMDNGGSASCSDGIQNQGETGIDCGGPCPACGCGSNYIQMNNGSCCGPCAVPGQSPGNCDYYSTSGPGGTCLPSCGALGGTSCCANGCASGDVGQSWDCPSCCTGGCAPGQCIWGCAAEPTCSDGIQNQGETGVDCGGPCAACPECTVRADCAYLDEGCDCDSGCRMRGRCNNGVCQAFASCCFSGGTSILTPKGLVSIKKLSVGSTILSWDDKKKELVPARVELLHRRSSDELFRITFSNGVVLDTTSEHPFYDPQTGDYKFISEFKVGDPVFFLKDHQKKGVLLRIKNFKKISGSFTVYTLSVGGKFNNFFAGGVLVHNKCMIRAEGCMEWPPLQ